MSKITIFSNYLNHHQLPLCKELVKLTNNNFNFVANKAISVKRISLGYKDISNDYDFLVKTYDGELEKAYELMNDSDIVIESYFNEKSLSKRLHNKKIIFKPTERINKINKRTLIDYLYCFKRFTRYNNLPLYVLCCGMQTSYDLSNYYFKKEKMFKWGYFPETIEYNINELLSRKNDKTVNILWVGRLLDWKHPEYAINLAKKLKEENYDFNINIIGNGELENKIKDEIRINGLTKNIKLLGSMSPEEVRKHMEEANIFMLTSDRREGWGAALNEAMNSGCACIANHEAGSTGYLINHQKNGLIFKNGDFEDFYNKVKFLINDKGKRISMQKEAYYTIRDTWNAKVAAERLLNLCVCLEERKETPFKDGPCSIAPIIKDKDLYKYLINLGEQNV